MATFAQVTTRRLVRYTDDNGQRTKVVVDNISSYYRRRGVLIIETPSVRYDMPLDNSTAVDNAITLLDGFY